MHFLLRSALHCQRRVWLIAPAPVSKCGSLSEASPAQQDQGHWAAIALCNQQAQTSPRP